MTMIAEIDGKTWKTALDAVWIAATKDKTRPVLGSVKVEANGSLRLIACDSYRAHIASIPVKCETAIEVLANASALHKIKVGKQVSLAIQGTALSVNGQVVPGCEDRYPDYRQVIPTRFAWSFQIDAGELRDSVTFVSAVAMYGANIVVLDDGFLSTHKLNEGDAFCLLETMIVTGPMPRLAFNYRYLADALRGETGQVTVSGNDDTKPVLVQGQVAERVVMPMQVGR
jgi:DNA polymerase III sliding clamp (beta) subunit (PCNA family)